MDPAMEHSVVIMGRPLQAFPQQNHEQHIKSHRTFMSSKMIANNPMIVMSLISHINMHVSLLATQTVDKALVEEAEKLPIYWFAKSLSGKESFVEVSPKDIDFTVLIWFGTLSLVIATICFSFSLFKYSKSRTFI